MAMARPDYDPPKGKQMDIRKNAYMNSQFSVGQKVTFFQSVREQEIENNLPHSSQLYNLKTFNSMTVLRNLKDDNGDFDTSNMHELVEKCGSTTAHVHAMAIAMKLSEGTHNWFASSCDMAKLGKEVIRKKVEQKQAATNQHYTTIVAAKDVVIENWHVSMTEAVPLVGTLLIALGALMVASTVLLAMYVGVSKAYILIGCFAVFIMGVAVWACTLLSNFEQRNAVEEKTSDTLGFPAKIGGYVRGNTPTFLQRDGFLLWAILVFILFAAAFLPNLFLWWYSVVFTTTFAVVVLIGSWGFHYDIDDI